MVFETSRLALCHTNIASSRAIRCVMTVRGRFVKHYRVVDMPHLAFAVDRPGA